MSLSLFCGLGTFVFAANPADQVWSDSLDYFEQEGDRKALETLGARILQERPSNFENLKRLLEIELKGKDRQRLNRLFGDILEANACVKSTLVPDRAICERLSTLWHEHLASYVFFEDTARKMENARRQIQAKNCRLALDSLQEVETREGVFASLLQQRARAYSCLGDAESTSRTLKLLETDFWMPYSL